MLKMKKKDHPQISTTLRQGSECNMTNIFRVSLFCSLLHGSLGEWDNIKVWEKKEMFAKYHEADVR